MLLIRYFDFELVASLAKLSLDAAWGLKRTVACHASRRACFIPYQSCLD